MWIVLKNKQFLFETSDKALVEKYINDRANDKFRQSSLKEKIMSPLIDESIQVFEGRECGITFDKTKLQQERPDVWFIVV